MAEAVAKETVCQACGADIRPDSLFCYACGGSIEAEEDAIKQPDSSDAWLRGDLGDDGRTDQAGTSDEGLDVEGDPGEATKEQDETVADEKKKDSIGKVEIKARSPQTDRKEKLTTAASLRKKPKSVRNKRVEVVWEEHDNSPNIWFLAGAAILTILGGVLFYLAMYLK